MKKTFKNEQGFSALTLLPWLLFFVLAFVFWWFVNQPQNAHLIHGTPQTPIQEQPQVIEKQENNGELKAFSPALATPMTEVAPTGDTASPITSYHQAVAKASVSVVNIYTTQKIANPYGNDPFFGQFLEQNGIDVPDSQDDTNLGSGVIVSKDGYIVTNAHVIEKADEITVAFNDGRKAKAVVVGKDPDSDLAVIKVEMNDLTPLAFRQSPIKVGDVTLAIGNPFGVGQTVTQGIVSATGRSGVGGNLYEDFIQTDAAINPGNSGGALVDAHGALIGINTMIYSRSGGSMGIGFAIPTDIVEQVMNDLIKSGKVSRGWLGIEIGRVVNDPTSLNATTGVTVAGVLMGGPAQSAGLQVGDVIVAIDGVPMNDVNVLTRAISKKKPMSQMQIDIERNGQKQTLTATLGERPTRQN